MLASTNHYLLWCPLGMAGAHTGVSLIRDWVLRPCHTLSYGTWLCAKGWALT